MGKKHKQLSPFSLEGRFLGFGIEDGFKIKYLYLATASGEHCIKLTKEARASVRGVLTPGDWIWVMGEQSVERDGEEVKYRATRIRQAAPGQRDGEAIPTPMAQTKPKAQTTILVCQKSDCMKRGGKAVCQALQSTLSDRGLENQVVVKGTGCMKDCKAGPNLVVMPGKQRYSRVSPRDIPALIERHIPQSQPEPIAPSPECTPVS
jgi:(2Fe-2S) ferredoxin